MNNLTKELQQINDTLSAILKIQQEMLTITLDEKRVINNTIIKNGYISNDKRTTL